MKTKMARALRWSALVGSLIVVGFASGWIVSRESDAILLERTVAMSWGDGKYGKAFYGAHVYMLPINEGWSVQARIYLGRGNDYFRDCGELGRVTSAADAVARWGQIRWRDEGLYIGSGSPKDFFVPRSVFEAHR